MLLTLSLPVPGAEGRLHPPKGVEPNHSNTELETFPWGFPSSIQRANPHLAVIPERTATQHHFKDLYLSGTASQVPKHRNPKLPRWTLPTSCTQPPHRAPALTPFPSTRQPPPQPQQLPVPHFSSWAPFQVVLSHVLPPAGADEARQPTRAPSSSHMFLRVQLAHRGSAPAFLHMTPHTAATQPPAASGCSGGHCRPPAQSTCSEVTTCRLFLPFPARSELCRGSDCTRCRDRTSATTSAQHLGWSCAWGTLTSPSLGMQAAVGSTHKPLSVSATWKKKKSRKLITCVPHRFSYLFPTYNLAGSTIHFASPSQTRPGTVQPHAPSKPCAFHFPSPQ